MRSISQFSWNAAMQQTEISLLLDILIADKEKRWFLAHTDQRESLVSLAHQGLITITTIRPGIWIVSLTNAGRKLGEGHEND